MTVKPLTRSKPKGLAPLDEPLAGPAIEARLTADRIASGEKPTAGGTRLRCSDALACSRKIAFASLGVPKDIELSTEAMLAFRAGDFYHDIVQEALVREFDARLEVPVDYSPDLSLSGSADAVYVRDGTVCGEFKSMAGYAFKIATGQVRSDEGPGPKVEHIVQAGLYALAPQIEADWLHMIYLSKDTHMTAEWLIGVDEELPYGGTVRELVLGEKRRLAGILNRLDKGDLPRRFIVGVGLVEDPPAADTKSQPWQCRYCPYQPRCSTQSPDVIPGWVSEYVAEKEAS